MDMSRSEILSETLSIENQCLKKQLSDEKEKVKSIIELNREKHVEVIVLTAKLDELRQAYSEVLKHFPR